MEDPNMTTGLPLPAASSRPRAVDGGTGKGFPIARLIVSLAIAGLAGCMTAPPRNQPLDHPPEPGWLDRSQLASSARSGRVLMVLTFSGGGTRAAAFSYGVLRELAELQLPLDGASRRALDEIDLISSVSGGSFTAAYFGLHGEGIFDGFEESFLRKNVQRGLLLEVLRPRYWLGLMRIDRSQLAARYYDRKLFHEATFRDMRREGAPEIVINSTDLSSGRRFPFSRPSFAP